MQQFNSKDELERLFYHVTARCLDMNPESKKAQGRIRKSWPTNSRSAGSNPGWEREDDVVFLRIERGSDPYSIPQDTAYLTNECGKTVERVKYTVSHKVTWIFYGPHATEDSDTVRLMLLRDNIQNLLRAKRIFIIYDILDPIRMDELDGGQWWHRCDFTAHFYEGAIRDFPAEIIERVPNIIMRKD